MAYHDAFSNEERAYIAGKGWDRLTDEAAAQAILKSYMNLEKMRPAPVEAPKSAAEYTFDGVTLKDGAAPDASVLDFVRQQAFALKLPLDAAKTLAVNLLGFAQTAEEAEAANAITARATAEGTLKASWKEAHDERLALSNRALTAAGFSPEDIAAMENVKGFDKVHEMGYGLATKMGEAPLLRGGGMDNNQPKYTRETALVERNRLMTDQAFGAKFAAGDAEAMATINELSRAIIGTPDNWQPPPENFGRKHDHLGHEVTADSPSAV